MTTHPLRIGIVGGGNVGEHFLRDFQSNPDVSVCGVVTRSAERQQELASRFHVPAFSTTSELLQCDPPPQVVCVVNANHDHLDATLEALAAGCHVYLENRWPPPWPNHGRSWRRRRHLRAPFRWDLSISTEP